MTRIILIFGTISGLIVSALMLGSIALMQGDHAEGSMLIGYLTMLIALSFIFLAVKRHRDINLGGMIKFWPALGLGLGITLVAGLFYVISWDIYFQMSGGSFMTDYFQAQVDARIAAGATPEDIAAFEAETRPMMELYRNWWFRMPLTFTEIAPVGLLVSLVSAGLLRNPNLLPRRA